MTTPTRLGRSNTFRVENLDALKADLRKYGIQHGPLVDAHLNCTFVIHERPDGSIAIFSYDGWPSFDEEILADRLGLEDDEPLPEDAPHSVMELISEHLVEDQIAVFLEIGNEGMRYFFGGAIAVNANGDEAAIDLNDIYALAETNLRESTTAPITLAEY